MTSRETAGEKASRLLTKKDASSVTSSVAGGSVERVTGVRHYRRAESVSTLSYADEPTQFMRRPVRYENTYQLRPTKTFPTGQVEKIVKDVFDSYLENEKYNPELCRHMAKNLSEVVRSRVKELMLPRYKIICIVYIGELNNQTMRIASRCLWDSGADQSSTYEFRNNSLFAVCTVFGVYHE